MSKYDPQWSEGVKQVQMNATFKGGGNGARTNEMAKGFITSPVTVTDPTWYMDSEATDHVISNSN